MERKRSVRRRRLDKPLMKRCKDLFRQFIAFLFSNIGIIGLVVCYTVIGAFLFRHIEKNYHMKILNEVNITRNLLINKLWNITIDMNPFNENDYKNVIINELFNYQNDMVKYILSGYDGVGEDYSTKWSFAGAFLYSLTVITTIGYGNISPHTVEGKIVTIIYAIIGMPLFLLYLSNIGDIMARSFKWIYANCCLCRWCPNVARKRAERRRQRQLAIEQQQQQQQLDGADYIDETDSIEQQNDDDDDEEISEDSYDIQTVTVPVTICLMIMVGYICGGALLFCKWEEWEFLDASYFCFISLSTIGFGDLVPGDKIYGHGEDIVGEVLELSFIFCSMYLMLGMALIAMCFNLMQEEVIHKIRTTVRTVKYILRCNR